MRHFAIVGSGPAGFYTAEALEKAYGEKARIDIIDRYAVPYGLIRFGVAPDHQSLKAVSKRYDKVAESAGVDFIGNVTVGRDAEADEPVGNGKAVEDVDASLVAIGLFERLGGVESGGSRTDYCEMPHSTSVFATPDVIRGKAIQLACRVAALLAMTN